MEDVKEMQNTVEESPLVDSSTTENVPVLDTTQQQVAKEGAVEDTNVIPKANVEGEVKRRLQEEMMPIIQQTVRELMNQGQQARPIQTQSQITSEEPKYKGYTKAQLENVVNHPEATEQDRQFANRGLIVLETKEEAAKEFDTRTQKLQSQSRQQLALGEIIKDYPQVYVKETNSWNASDPLFQRGMQIFNSDPRFQQLGNEGLQVAMDRAFAQLTREGSLNLKKKEVAINAKERQTQKLQSQAMTQGSQGAPSKETGTGAKLQKLMADYSKSQDPKIFQEIAKLKGLIPSNL
jgi:hypothetical protein